MATQSAKALLSIQSSARISDYAVAKQSPKVITQNPPAGTPVLEGMTIEVRTVSYSDVPFHVLAETEVVDQARNLMLADIEKVIEADPQLANAVKVGGIPENDRSVVTEKLNVQLSKSGLSRPMSMDDANRFIQQVAQFGFVDL